MRLLTRSCMTKTPQWLLLTLTVHRLSSKRSQSDWHHASLASQSAIDTWHTASSPSRIFCL
ncbi:hypothetical protein IE81DRAFT_166467 [Ceraceosorus guamensis]|uniref:Uncharacterized protein n=1 Tax=Ceraceosorus guamensis TaxID=1522189 RepID=A0A316W771_9BASI|nr:hypothetical protein IE81DRAFT_166467 [Ceraceosorus guamensis]PWN45699.1 hypothetical protein IE81DRAFT_166467 [Ceraceosorus guamensis]